MLPSEYIPPSEVAHSSTPLTVALPAASSLSVAASVTSEEAGPVHDIPLPAAKKREREEEITLTDDSLAALPHRPAKRPHRHEDLEKHQYRRNLALTALSVVAQHWKLFPCSLCISASVSPRSLPSFHSFVPSFTSSESPSHCPFPSIALSSTVLNTTSTVSSTPSPVLSPRSTVMHRFASPKDFFFAHAVEENLSRLQEIVVPEGNDAYIYNNNNDNDNDNNNAMTGEEQCLFRLFRALSINCSLFSPSNPLPVNPFATAAEEVGECSEDQDDEDNCDDLFAEEDYPTTPVAQFRSLLGKFLQQLLFNLSALDEDDPLFNGNDLEPTYVLHLQKTKRMLEFAVNCLFLISHHFLLERWLDGISTFDEVEIGENESDPLWVVLSQINGDLEHLEKCALSLIFVCDLVSTRCVSSKAMSASEQGSLIVFLLKLLDEFSVRCDCVDALSDSLSSLATQFSFSLFLPSQQ